MTKKKETVTTENTVPVVSYKRGDEFEFRGKQVKVVEVLQVIVLNIRSMVKLSMDL